VTRPESETEVGLAVLSWWLRLSDEQRARYDAMRAAEPPDAEPPDVDEGTTTRG
jgi:hypothetical protein